MVKSGLEKFFLEIPPFAHHVIFITEFVLLIKTPHFYEANSFDRKWLEHGGISKIFFSRPHFVKNINNFNHVLLMLDKSCRFQQI